MATVWIPALLRDLTGGRELLDVPGETVRQLVENLEAAYPGMRERLCPEGRLRPGLAVVVDGQVSRQGLRRRLDAASEVHFLPALSGGAAPALPVEIGDAAQAAHRRKDEPDERPDTAERAEQDRGRHPSPLPQRAPDDRAEQCRAEPQAHRASADAAT
jgi:molybdopterin synthase sulfur carrier subunit